MEEDQIDDSQGPVEAVVGRGFRCTAEVQDATVISLCLDAEVSCLTLSRLATYGGCRLTSPGLKQDGQLCFGFQSKSVDPKQTVDH